MRNPFPLSASARWAIAAWALYLFSYSMLALTGHDAMDGFSAAWSSLICANELVLEDGFKNGESLSWATLFWTLSNFAFLLSCLLIGRPRKNASILLAGTYGAAALTPAWALSLFDNLGPGFFTWWLSFGLLFVAFCLRPMQKSAGRPAVSPKLQFSLSALLMLALACGALLGLNMAYQNHLANLPTFGREGARAFIPFTVAASLLALVLFFDLWEARRLRAGSAAK